jgi:hypothetical protein
VLSISRHSTCIHRSRISQGLFAPSKPVGHLELSRRQHSRLESDTLDCNDLRLLVWARRWQAASRERAHDLAGCCVLYDNITVSFPITYAPSTPHTTSCLVLTRPDEAVANHRLG